jgi:hypothetical protein
VLLSLLLPLLALLAVLVAGARIRDRPVEAAFRAAGATSPGRARPRGALPPLPPEAFDRLVAQGRVREGAPGTFYLYDVPVAKLTPTRKLLLWLLAVYVLILWAVLLWPSAPLVPDAGPR